MPRITQLPSIATATSRVVLSRTTHTLANDIRPIARSLCTSSRPRRHGNNAAKHLTNYHDGDQVAQIPFIPWKMKEEILALRAEDPTRWTATSLARRFSAPHENVVALLRLGELRAERDEYIASLPDAGTRATIERMRSNGTAAWSAICNVSAGRHRKPITKPSDSVPDISAVTDGEKAEDQETTEQQVQLDKSRWMEYIENNLDNVETDTVRKTSFAFIEVGKPKQQGKLVQRAMWIRDGATGKLRMADEEEQKLLKKQVKVRDSTAFL